MIFDDITHNGQNERISSQNPIYIRYLMLVYAKGSFEYISNSINQIENETTYFFIYMIFDLLAYDIDLKVSTMTYCFSKNTRVIVKSQI